MYLFCSLGESESDTTLFSASSSYVNLDWVCKTISVISLVVILINKTHLGHGFSDKVVILCASCVPSSSS